MRWARFSALVGAVLLLLLISGPPFGFLPRDQWGNHLLYARYHSAYAGGLGDVFGDKNDGSDEGASNEGTSDNSSTSDQGEKTDTGSGGLADVFGKKDKDGGSSGPYTTEPQKPPSHSTYPSYEHYPEAYPRAHPRPDSRPSSVHLDPLEAALEDITLSWLTSDVSYLERHLPPDGQVKVYRGTDLLEILSRREFLQATQEAFQGFKTVSFTFGKPHFEAIGEVYCPAEHLLAGPDGVIRRAQVGYQLVRIPPSSDRSLSSPGLPSGESSLSPMTTEPSAPPSEWVIKSVNQDISELLRSRCFIATAAYGSPMAEDVRLLREFRNRFLLTNLPGRLFVRLYYQLSPPLARRVACDPALAAEVRLLLKPLVTACRLALRD